MKSERADQLAKVVDGESVPRLAQMLENFGQEIRVIDALLPLSAIMSRYLAITCKFSNLTSQYWHLEFDISTLTSQL